MLIDCLIEEENYFSDDGDFNLSKCKKKVDNFFLEKLKVQVKDEYLASLKHNSLFSYWNINNSMANTAT